MSILRVVVLAFAVACVTSAFAAPSASAYEDFYCRRVIDNSPTQECVGTGWHSYDYNQAFYPGRPADNVYVCEYLYNHSTTQIRGGIVKCAKTLADYFYGPTGVASYSAHLYLDPITCCPHTVNGYATA